MIIQDMTFKKSTKGTHVYGSVNNDAPVAVLYIKKDALPKDIPQNIKVTIDDNSM